MKSITVTARHSSEHVFISGSAACRHDAATHAVWRDVRSVFVFYGKHCTATARLVTGWCRTTDEDVTSFLNE